MSSQMFDASVSITDLLAKSFENAAKDLAVRCIIELGSRYNFNVDEEIRILGLDRVNLIRKKIEKKTKETSPSKEKKDKHVCPMPFICDKVNNTLCNGLVYNHGLFTQCQKKPFETRLFCKTCFSQGEKNKTGIPDCGTINTRIQTGYYEFKDPKGRTPTPYLKVLEKLKISKETAIEESHKLNLTIPPEHFTEIKQSTKPKGKGRPKKTNTVETDNVTDLFQDLVAQCEEEGEITDTSDEDKPKKKTKLTDEERAKQLELREQKKQQREAEKAEKQKQKEEIKAKEEKLRQELKALKESTKTKSKKTDSNNDKSDSETNKSDSEEETKPKKSTKKNEKETKPKKSTKKNEEDTKPKKSTKKNEEEPEEIISVQKREINGKMYLVSKDNIVYDTKTKMAIGTFDKETNKIIELPDDDSEEEMEDSEEEIEEDNYDSD